MNTRARLWMRTHFKKINEDKSLDEQQLFLEVSLTDFGTIIDTYHTKGDLIKKHLSQLWKIITHRNKPIGTVDELALNIKHQINNTFTEEVADMQTTILDEQLGNKPTERPNYFG